MALTDQVIMPGADYQAAADQVRSLNGTTGTLKSGEMVTALEGANDTVASQTTQINALIQQANNLPDAGGGTDIALGITGAAVGQIAKITAVDADGKPTAWTPVDMPSGGGGDEWELIKEITLDDAANVITINQDMSGNAFALKRVMIDCVIQLNTADPFTSIKAKINGHTASANATPQSASANPRYYAFYAELIPGSGALCWHACSGNNYNWGGDLQKMGYKYNGLWQANAITSIELTANDGAKNVGIAGTKVHVMGVKK